MPEIGGAREPAVGMRSTSERVLSKVPEVTLTFWVIKILATTLGETGGDAVSMSMNLGYAASSVIFIGIFMVAVAAQIAANRFRPLLYWLSFLPPRPPAPRGFCGPLARRGLCRRRCDAVRVVDGVARQLVLVRRLGLGRYRRHTRDRSVLLDHDPVLANPGHGGDWTADTNGFGYGGGALLFVAGLALLLGLYFFTRVSRTLLFWSAFILTRPLGATVGDLLDKPTAEGGLALSRFYASGILVGLILACILILPQKAGGHPGARAEVS
jgi:uncharacterized membrane-anchored protein